MGFYLKLLAAKFEIPKDKATEAHEVLAEFHAGIISPSAGSDLGKIFADLAWPLKQTKTGWVMVDGQDCKQGWEQQLFETAAPFVRDGSTIRARGEDGEEVVWRFSRGQVEIVDDESEEDVPEGDYIKSVHLSISPAQLRPAFVQLEQKLPKLLAKLEDPSSVTAAFDRLGWQTSRGRDGTLVIERKRGASPMLTERDARVLRTLEAFVAPDSQIVGTTSWRVVFSDGRYVRQVKK
jgi:hypothetical protein